MSERRLATTRIKAPTLKGEGIYAVLACLKIKVKRGRRRWQSFWDANEADLEWLYPEIQRAVRQRIMILHPDRGGKADEFRAFRTASQRLINDFRRRGFGEKTRLPLPSLPAPASAGPRRAPRPPSPTRIAKKATRKSVMGRLGKWSAGVSFTTVTAQEPVIVRFKKGASVYGMFRERRAEQARQLFMQGCSIREVIAQVKMDSGTANNIRKKMAVLPSCACGRKLGHKGNCFARVAKSAKCQAMLEKFHAPALQSQRAMKRRKPEPELAGCTPIMTTGPRVRVHCQKHGTPIASIRKRRGLDLAEWWHEAVFPLWEKRSCEQAQKQLSGGASLPLPALRAFDAGPRRHESPYSLPALGDADRPGREALGDALVAGIVSRAAGDHRLGETQR